MITDRELGLHYLQLVKVVQGTIVHCATCRFVMFLCLREVTCIYWVKYLLPGDIRQRVEGVYPQLFIKTPKSGL